MESKWKHDFAPKQNCNNNEFMAGSNVHIFWNVYNACFTTIPHTLQKMRKERLKEENLGLIRC